MFDIKKFRKTKGLTQNDFAAQLGYARTTISNMESGVQPVNDTFLDKVAEIFGIEVEEFKSHNRAPSEEENWKAKYYALLEKYNACLETNNSLLQAQQTKVAFPDKTIS